ncbi:MAG TPA: NAD(P)/FAD-dependent oxidoreductase [Candidatus Saccharimonadales bacterium]|nr:NAD(P)/FAD-dependent oxidoreductase [Candidatus Saccharimonadales bacterium]
MRLLKRYDFDLIVLGSGSGGAVGASLAAAKGKRVAIFERETVVGGECPNWACVPTKALLHAAHVYETVRGAAEYGVKTGPIEFNYKKVRAWKDLVVSRTGTAEGEKAFAEEGITVIKAAAKFTGSHQVTAKGKTYSAKNFLIATGTTDFVPPIAGLKQTGYITFRQAIDLPTPPKSLFVIGGGPIGCEFTQLFMSFGTKVHIADSLPRLLAKEDAEVGELVGAILASQGVQVLAGCLVTKVERKGHQKLVHCDTGGHKRSIIVDEILVAAGKAPRLDIGLEQAGVRYSRTGIATNRQMQTSVSHIYAAGDVVGPFQFTHTASYQSRIAAHNMYSRKKLSINYSSLPRAVFVRPEVASAGMSEETAKANGIRVKTGAAPIAILGRANTSNDSNGFVKVITDRKGVLIGASIVAPRAGEMIHELALAIKLKATAQQVADQIHAFPTFSEAIKMACGAVR